MNLRRGRVLPARRRVPAAGAVLVLLCAVGVVQAQEQSYTIDPEHTFPMYEIEHFGVTRQHGRFNDTRGTIVLNPAAGTGKVDVTIAAASVDSGVPVLDRRLKGESFFDTARFPQIIFRSTGVRFKGEQPVAVEGELTMLGKTRPLTLEITRFSCTVNPLAGGKRCGAMARATLLRSDFGLSSYRPPLLGDEVLLNIPVEALLDR